MCIKFGVVTRLAADVQIRGAVTRRVHGYRRSESLLHVLALALYAVGLFTAGYLLFHKRVRA